MMKQNKLYVANLPIDTNDQAVSAEFSKFGKIEDLALIPDRQTGELKGFGFITFCTQQAAESALKMNGELFGGRALKVSMAQSQSKSRSNGRR
jgi:cold-inducible RNA-binding protein